MPTNAITAPPVSRTTALPDPAELARLRANLTEILEEPNLKTLEADWLAKMLNGVIISLSIGRIGCKAALTDLDLGIAHGKKQSRERRQAWYDLGDGLLLPRRYATALDSKESSARKWLATCAARTYWGSYVSAAAYPRWKEGNERYKTEYFALRDEIVAHYEAIVAEVCAEHGELARDAYARLCRQDKAFRARHPDPEHYITERVALVRSRIPAADRFRDSFYYTVELSYIPLPSLLAQDRAAAEQIRADAAAAATLRREAYERTLESKQALITLFQRDMIAKVQDMLYQVSVDVLASV